MSPAQHHNTLPTELLHQVKDDSAIELDQAKPDANSQSSSSVWLATEDFPSPALDQQNKEDAVVELGQTTNADDYPHGLRLALIVFTLLLSMFLIAIDMTIVATAIPRITDEFHSVADVGWYGAAFFITLAVFQSPWGKAYKHFNLKATFMTAVILFELGSLICGVAKNSITLILGRAIAGLGGAGVTGGIYVIMAFIVPPPKVPAYIGLVGAVFSVASVAGPPLGGVFTGEVSWRWVFYINLPVGGVALVLLIIYFHTPAAVKAVPITAKDLVLVMDLPGIVLSLGALICFTLAMQWGGIEKPWSSPDVIGTLVGFVLLTILFGALQWWSGERSLLVTRILKNRTVATVTAFVSFLNATNFLLVYNLPLYFQVINGVSATDSGVRNLSLILTTALAALGGGYLLSRIGYYQVFLITGAASLTLGSGLVYTLDIDSSIGKIVGYQLLVGLGVGFSLQVPVTTAQAFSAPEDIPVVTAVVMFFQLAAGAMCVSASQTLMNNRLVTTLAHLAPHIRPQQVFAVGATDLRRVFQGADLNAVLRAYMVGLKDSWALATALAGVSFLFAFGGEWKSIKGAKPDSEADDFVHTSGGEAKGALPVVAL